MNIRGSQNEKSGIGKKRTQFDIDPLFEPPIGAMSQLILIPGPSKTKRTQTAILPTKGQIKKLSQEAEKILHRRKLPKTPDNLFLAMVTLLTMAVSVRLVPIINIGSELLQWLRW